MLSMLPVHSSPGICVSIVIYSRVRANTCCLLQKSHRLMSAGTVRYHMLVGRTISSHQRARRIAAYGTTLVGRQKPLSHNITDRIRNDSASVAVVIATSATLSILRWVTQKLQCFVCWSTACNETMSSSSSFCFHMTPTFTGRKIRFSMCRSTWILKATPVLAHCCIFCPVLAWVPLC